MTGKDLFKLAKYVGAISLICGAFYTAWPRTIGDYPPLANRDRVEEALMQLRQAVKDAGSAVTTEFITGRLFTRRSDQCAAIDEGNMRLASTIGEQIQDLRDRYLMLTGLPFELRPCIEF